MKHFFMVEYTDKANPKGRNLNSYFDTWEEAEKFSRWLKNDEKCKCVILSWWIFNTKQKHYILKYLKEIR